MNRRRLVMIGVLALAVAFALTAVTYRVMRSKAMGGPATTTAPVVVADTDLALGRQIQATDVRIAQLPVSEVPVGAFRSKSEVIGRGVLTSMAKSEPVLASKLAETAAGGGLPPRIPHGMRAVSVKVNEVVAVAGYVKAGTRVDVLLTGSPTRNDDPGRVMTTTVLQNVIVLTVGQDMQERGDSKPVPDATVVTLLVSPEDAQRLTLASTQGKIQLALRNPLDLEPASTPALVNASLYGAPPVSTTGKSAGKKVVFPPAPTAYTVELIRGDKKDITTF
ncbi:MAG TPA: Flp pilus assembly protein CpaB [Terriglobales bacterium]|jgi:pilus assembly protein CpaB|nr:Flp pilus assembly protein CpaB [Terriglobales bacterium]